MGKWKNFTVFGFILASTLWLLPFLSFAQNEESDQPNRFRQPIGPVIIIQEPLAVKNLSIENVAKNSFQIKVKTNLPSSIEIFYGKKRNKLTSRVSSDKTGQDHLVAIKNLKKKQTYYFKAVVQDKDNSTLESAVYKIKTKKR